MSPLLIFFEKTKFSFSPCLSSQISISCSISLFFYARFSFSNKFLISLEKSTFFGVTLAPWVTESSSVLDAQRLYNFYFFYYNYLRIFYFYFIRSCNYFLYVKVSPYAKDKSISVAPSNYLTEELLLMLRFLTSLLAIVLSVLILLLILSGLLLKLKYILMRPYDFSYYCQWSWYLWNKQSSILLRTCWARSSFRVLKWFCKLVSYRNWSSPYP